MKGIIFETFINHVEDNFGLEVADRMIVESDLPTQGAYTAVGTYQADEFVSMLATLSEIVERDASKLLREFGHNLFFKLGDAYPDLVGSGKDAFGLITQVDEHIHREVLKLYPDADLPSFTHELVGPDTMHFVYRSKRGFVDLAYGLISGCADFFGENITIEVESEPESPSKAITFILTRLQQSADG